jgi:hypothetical protein
LPDKLCFGQPPISAGPESRPALCLTNARGGDINFKPGDDDRDRPSPLAAAMKLRLWIVGLEYFDDKGFSSS